MKNQMNHLTQGGLPEMQAMQAITQISQWVRERYPRISDLTKSRLITQCLMEVAAEKSKRQDLN